MTKLQHFPPILALLLLLCLESEMMMIHAFSLPTTATTLTTATAKRTTKFHHHGRFQTPDVRRNKETTTMTTTTTTTTTLFFSKSEEKESPENFKGENDSSSSSNNNNIKSNKTSSGGLDVSAIGKYLFSIAVQLSLMAALFQGLDQIVVGGKFALKIPFALNVPFFYLLALKSRILNPLSNRRPNVDTKEVSNAPTAAQRKMPSWTPPGFIFPIVWLLLIGPLRAVTSSMIVSQTGKYLCQPIMALMLHLSIGDVWNTINNVERRYGTSVLGVLCVWMSAAFCAHQYYLVYPLAGKLLAAKLIWLTIATSLITRTWQLNPVNFGNNNKNNKLAPLLPTKGDGQEETKLIWFSK